MTAQSYHTVVTITGVKSFTVLALDVFLQLYTRNLPLHLNVHFTLRMYD
jgi:hypothetical protein